ncbi:MAG: hypothetical protein QOG50_2595, partial [Actinomycetota bacterium]|nr:hypothetical protein [Actinomycetota bacterium]
MPEASTPAGLAMSETGGARGTSPQWNGLGVGLANVWRLADAETRSI